MRNLSVYVLDNGVHESVGSYRVSPLMKDLVGRSWYPGITNILKIKKDGKLPRVGIDCIKNTKDIKEIFDDK